MFGRKNDSFTAHFGPRFGRGDIKFVLLELLHDKPRHGYDIIQELEKKFFGCYTPSSGTIYPTLQQLEDQNLLTSEQKEGKKVYALSDKGSVFLAEHTASLAEMKCRIGESWGEQGKLIAEIREIFSATAQQLFKKTTAQSLTETQKEELKNTFKKLNEDVSKIIT